MARRRYRISLALQGGGAHGAFSWGVLDRLLEDETYEIGAISGTSAGAINAVLVADGLLEDGPQAARAKLEKFWTAVGRHSTLSPVRRSPIDAWLGNWSLDRSPGMLMLDMLTRFVSPYDINPLGLNPLRPLVGECVDFERLGASREPKLFIAATNVANGTAKVFRNDEISLDVTMASACLPSIFQAVEIDGQSYWDGGYSGNPVLFPHLFEAEADDVVLVQINPVERAAVPKSAREIANRVDEITFNASLIRELRAIAFVSRLAGSGTRLPAGLRALRMHRIDAGETLAELSSSSKLNSERGFLRHLFEIGRETADAWIVRHGKDLGRKATFDPIGDMPLFPNSQPFRLRDYFRGRKAS